jgi:hypothetical protein
MIITSIKERTVDLKKTVLIKNKKIRDDRKIFRKTHLTISKIRSPLI